MHLQCVLSLDSKPGQRKCLLQLSDVKEKTLKCKENCFMTLIPLADAGVFCLVFFGIFDSILNYR